MRDCESEVLVEDEKYEVYWYVPGGNDRQNKLVHASKFTKHSNEIKNICSFYCESDYQEDYDEKYWINKFSYCFRIYTGGSEPLYLHILSYYENLKREDFIESYFVCYKGLGEIWSSEDEMAKQQHKAHFEDMREELMQVAMHPRRLKRHIELGGKIDDF